MRRCSSINKSDKCLENKEKKKKNKMIPKNNVRLLKKCRIWKTQKQ
jgi:hypothetical protein